MPGLLLAASSPHSSSAFPGWLAWALLALFAVSLIITAQCLRTRRKEARDADPWRTGALQDDGTTDEEYYESVTDPDVMKGGFTPTNPHNGAPLDGLEPEPEPARQMTPDEAEAWLAIPLGTA